MASTVLGRNIMQNNPPNRNTRLGEYAGFGVRPTNEERPSSVSVVPGLGNGTNGWGADIWGSSFKAQNREASKTREPASFLAPSNDIVEGTIGSAALSQSGDADIWGQTRSPWGTLDSSTAPTHTRGVSPAPRTNGQLQSQALLDPSQATSQFFAHSRAVSAVGNRPLHGSFDAPPSFSAPRNSDSLMNGLQHHTRGSDDSSRALGLETSRSSWADAFDPSPTDDHRSNNEFGPSSAEASRNGSLPPSRHSNEPLQYQPNDEGFPRLSSRHGPSFSGQNGRQYPERQNSQNEDAAYAMLGRLSLEDNGSHDQATVLRRPSATMNGSGLHEPSYIRPSHFDRSQSYEDPLPNGTYTPDGQPSSHYDHVNSVRGSRGAPRYGDRGALTPNSIDFRYPYSSTGGTPAVSQHKDYPRNSRHDPSRFAPNPMALDRRLRGIQQEQQQFIPPPYQQYFASQFRGPYNPYQPMYNYPNNMSFMNGFVPPMGIPPAMPLTTIMPGAEPPTGPRELDPNTVQSPFLRDFRMSSKSRRYDLKDIYGYAVEFSGDQLGSRFIQQKLETANSDEKAVVFKELLPDVMQLMQDVFGNYVIQKFFEHGDQNQKKVLANRMKGHVVNLSMQMYGCRVVQKALEHVLTDQQVELVNELESDVMKCLKDQNGNHVIQKAVERVPAEHIQFIVDTLVGQINTMAMHAYGCRVVQRMLERCEAPYRSIILQELHACGESLITDQYGNYVAQHVIKHGDLESRNKMINLVLLDVPEYSKHKFASNVVEKCLVHGTDDQRREIMMKVLAKTDSRDTGLYGYIKCGFGNYVIQTLLDQLCDQDYMYFVDNLRPELLKAKRSVPKKPVEAVETKMHRFNRHNSVGTIPLQSPNATGGAPAPFLNGHSAASSHVNGTISPRGPQLAAAQTIIPIGGPVCSTSQTSIQPHHEIALSKQPTTNGTAVLPLPTVDITTAP